MSEPSSLPRDPLYGWILVAIVFTLSTLSFGALGAVSVFLKPLAAEFGWGRGETAFGYTAIAFSATATVLHRHAPAFSSSSFPN